MSRPLFCAWLLAANVAGIALSLPEATQYVPSDDATFGWSPMPTDPPIAFHDIKDDPLFPVDLRKRQNLATCGYINGNTSNPQTCDSGLQCYTSGSLYGCCGSGSTCTPPTTCFSYDITSLCTGACVESARICSSTAYPFCNQNTLSSAGQSFYQIQCGRSPGGLQVFQTASSQAAGGASLTPPGSNSPTSSSQSSGQGVQGQSSPPSAGSPSSTSCEDDDDCPKPNHTGAIAGGVVGGVVGVALIVGAFIFWRVQQKKRARQGVVREMAQTG